IKGRRGRTAPNTHTDSGGPAPQGQAAVPGNGPGRSRYAFVPRSVASRKAPGSPPRWEGPVRFGSRPGRGVGRWLLVVVAVRRGSAAPWDDASASSPHYLRQLRADLVGPPTHRRAAAWSVAPPQSKEVGRGRRPIKASGCRGCGQRHTGADL